MALGPRHGPRRSLTLFRGVACDPNLLGVLVGMRRIDLEPFLNRVAAVLGVGALAMPLVLGHTVENLPRGPARGLEGIERRLYRAIVVQPARELVLVVAEDGGVVDGEEQAQSD